MQTKSFYYLAAALCCVGLIVMLLGGSGLNAETAEMLNTEQESYPQALEQFKEHKEYVNDALDDDPAFFAATALRWQTRLSSAEEQLRGAQAELDNAERLAQEKKDEDRASIESHLLHVREARNFALTESSEIHNQIEQLLELRKNRDSVVRGAQTDHEAIQAMSLLDTQTRVRDASRDWPKKAADLSRRFTELDGVRADASRLWETVQAQDSRRDSDIDYVLLAGAASGLHESVLDLSKANDHLLKLADQLYISWDKILADMAIEEGEDVKFMHKLQLVRVRVSGADAGGAGEALPLQESWQPVSGTEYEAQKENLGLALEVKAAGKYDSEAERATPQPPGYAYIAAPEQGSNQYGHWVNDRRGGSFWEFYGQYMFMRSLFWGPRYSPIYMNDYRGYRRSYDSGRTYYGSTSGGGKKYGSSSAGTRTRYSSSRYVATDGYKNSRYVQSGGKYKGSRYETKATRSRSSSSSSSTRRSSSSRSTSRSRGGK